MPTSLSRFGTAPSPTSAQYVLIAEIQARYYQFLRAGNPTSGWDATWDATEGRTNSALELEHVYDVYVEHITCQLKRCCK
ncbi:uncharacterized protein B0H18DRAFT_1120502 [Fomitopsis serialis]|uniref:uncharacterized protein n=1 Tax=Fomitopsis serialis TaxID=139415 RepID=UPI0020076281|nr:uncharacterized protein B0H18DRAFT_1120502 [Neoantrodia serialis]KAH9923234.1 hypothetical protein B0H18DRAFT_1120502 [Neoantrodia serialis]